MILVSGGHFSGEIRAGKGRAKKGQKGYKTNKANRTNRANKTNRTNKTNKTNRTNKANRSNRKADYSILGMKKAGHRDAPAFLLL